MAIADRVKNICLTPTTEWPVIAAEPASTGSLITGYVAPLAAIGAVAGFVGGSVIGRSLPFFGYYRVPFAAGLAAAVFSFVMAIVGVFLLSVVINALAPTFGGQKDSLQALKVAVYSYTPAWVAGVLHVLPLLGVLALLGALYGLYLLYLGLPRLMKSAEDQSLAYTAVVVVCAIVLSVVITAVGGVVVGAGVIGSGALAGTGYPQRNAGAGGGSSASEVQFDKNSAMGKLQELGKKLDASTKKMEVAEKKGDPDAQVAAGMEALGTILGGGRRVEPVAIEQLKGFVPEMFAGLARTGSNAQKTGFGGLMVSKAEATYGDGAQKSVTLEVSDSGGASGLVGLAGWAGMQEEKEDQYGSERTEKVNGRLTHQKISKTGGTNEFAVVLGDRFVVSAKGRGVDFPELKAAVASLELGKLESMKDLGVQK
jgi:Yip1 domain